MRNWNLEPLIHSDSSFSAPQDPLLELVYRVGAVARLANIPVETLRVWERRYGVVDHHPGQRHRHRFYSVRDVRRVSLIKKLVDLGSSISSIARLPLPELQQMYDYAIEVARPATAADVASPPETGKLRLMLVGPALRARFASAPNGLRSVEVVAQADSLQAVSAPVEADVLAVEVDTLQPDLKAHLERVLRASGARSSIIAYRFAASEMLEEFAMSGHAMHRAPLLIGSLDTLCALLSSNAGSPLQPQVAPAEEAPPPARFDERTLARIANLKSDLRCECPRHVTELLQSVSAFEKYSAQCANRGPEDAELHRHLAKVAAHCRQQFEEALIYVARVEGISLT